jgi:hypothetical protein
LVPAAAACESPAGARTDAGLGYRLPAGDHGSRNHDNYPWRAGEVILDQNDGLPDVCTVNLYNLQTVRKSALYERMAILPEAKLRQVEEALCWAQGMDRLLAD